MIAHTSRQLDLTEKQIRELVESLENDRFRTVAADRTGLISSLSIVREPILPEEIKEMNTSYFFPTSLEVFISKEGLILLSVNAWYPFFDIPCGLSRNISQIGQAIKYLEKKISNVVKEQVNIRIIRGVRRCLFEHPGAYAGYF